MDSKMKLCILTSEVNVEHNNRHTYTIQDMRLVLSVKNEKHRNKNERERKKKHTITT